MSQRTTASGPNPSVRNFHRPLFFVAFALVLAGCTSQPTPDVGATVEAAVGTAVAKERAKPTESPAPGRNEWLRAGREFLWVEGGIVEVAEGYDTLMVDYLTRLLRGKAGNGFFDVDNDQYWHLVAVQKEVSDRAVLIPLPPTPEGKSIMDDVLETLRAVEELRVATLNLPFQSSGESERAAYVIRKGRSQLTYETKWESARLKILQALRQNSISMSDLELDKMPRATPRASRR